MQCSGCYVKHRKTRSNATRGLLGCSGLRKCGHVEQPIISSGLPHTPSHLHCNEHQVTRLRFRTNPLTGYVGGCSSPPNQPFAVPDLKGSGRSQSKHWNVRFPVPQEEALELRMPHNDGTSVVQPSPCGTCSPRLWRTVNSEICGLWGIRYSQGRTCKHSGALTTSERSTELTPTGPVPAGPVLARLPVLLRNGPGTMERVA
jgi:hypothetical protein